MSNWIFRKGGRSRSIDWLALDSWLDSNLYNGWEEFKERWNTASSYFARFRLSGYKRAINEVLSEAMTLGTGGLAVMLTLAMPAFQEIDKGNWRATGQYSVTILDINGKEIGKRGILHSDAVPIEDIPSYMIKAALATEDRRFYSHFGIDVVGTFRALLANLRASGVVQGGSSITQQLAKNLFLTTERSLDRKIKEAFLAIWLETHLTKDEILKLYLDRAYMGGGTFGVEAASQYYFAKSVRDITLAEAAILAGLFKAPTKYAPHVNLAASRARTNEVLSNLVEAGFMTEGQVHSARLNPAKIVITRDPDSPDYFLDWIFEEVQRLAEGKKKYVLTAPTTIDPRLQKAAEEAMTLGTGGLAVMLTLAMPAFQEIDKGNWRATGQYSVTILDINGKEIGKRGILHSDAVPIEDIPSYMIKAALATEDRRFYSHFGIDVVGTFRALLANLRASGVVQGGSSITQQLAKNLFLTTERSLDRKIKEAFLAIWLETHLTKDEILKLYLDRAYMGGGTFGVEAASQYYFAKSVRDITLAEAAILAGLFKAPTKYAPHVNLAASRARTNEVLSNLVEAGFMTEGQVHSARLNPAKIVITRDPDSPDYFLDWIFEEVQRLAEGKKKYVLTARTTIDLRLQKAAEEAINTTLRQSGRSYRVDQAAMVAMETDGAVRAMVGGKDYGESQFNRAVHAFRQPGSSFKPYVYLTALENGYRPNSIVVDGHVSCGRWSPKNYSGGYRGRMTMARALAKSMNTVAVKLSLAVGREKVLANVHKLGLKWVKKTCSMALGDIGIPPLYHTSGYAVFANGGKAAYPYGITELLTTNGDVIYSRARDEPPPEQLFDPFVIENLNYMLGQVVTAGTGGRARLDFTTAAGKTGTSSGYKDAWFMGFTGKYVAGVWFGNDNFRPTNRVTGGSLPAMTWKNFMTLAHIDPNIPQIPGLPLHPNQVAERERLALLKRYNPTLAVKKQSDKTIMPGKTLAIMKNLNQTFRARSRTLPENNADRTEVPSPGKRASNQN